MTTTQRGQAVRGWNVSAMLLFITMTIVRILSDSQESEVIVSLIGIFLAAALGMTSYHLYQLLKAKDLTP